MPKLERFGIGKKIDQLFLQVLELSFSSSYLPPEQKIIALSRTISRLDVLKFMIQLAWESKLIPNEKYIELSKMLCEIGRMFGGWRKGLQNKTLTRRWEKYISFWNNKPMTVPSIPDIGVRKTIDIDIQTIGVKVRIRYKIMPQTIRYTTSWILLRLNLIGDIEVHQFTTPTNYFFVYEKIYPLFCKTCPTKSSNIFPYNHHTEALTAINT